MEYSKVLPLAVDPEVGYSLAGLTSDLLGHARANLSINSVVIPVLQTFNVLLEAGALRRLPEDFQGENRSAAQELHLVFPLISLSSLKDLHSLVTKNVARIKNVQRINESMKM